MAEKCLKKAALCKQEEEFRAIEKKPPEKQVVTPTQVHSASKSTTLQSLSYEHNKTIVEDNDSSQEDAEIEKRRHTIVWLCIILVILIFFVLVFSSK